MHITFFALSLALFLVACDGGEASGPVDSSSSAVESSETVSSVAESSSSALLSSSEEISSSSLLASSSSIKRSSSSIVALPCKTDTTDDCEYGTLVDERDGQTYRTVKIGDQVWMAENLNYAYLQPTKDLDSSSWCYDNDAVNCEKYGRLYLWSAAIDSAALFSETGKGFGDGTCYLIPEEPTPCEPSGIVRGVCPAGWHLPRYGEWYALYHMTGNDERFLKSKTDWIEENDGTDSFGFGALPSGFLYAARHELYFYYVGAFTDFWTPGNSGSPEAAFFVDMDGLETRRADEAFPVRCVKDTVAELDVSYGSLTDERDGQTYKTVTINGQTWMAENLNYAYLQPTSTFDSSSWCYDNDPVNCEKYGRLYIWSAVMDSVALFDDGGKGCGDGFGILREGGGGFDPICETREPVRGVCPEKWHVPSKLELEYLSTTLKYANMIKSTDEWQDGGDGTSTLGFDVLPSGIYITSRRSFEQIHYGAFIWSSTVIAPYVAHDYMSLKIIGPTFAMKLFADSTQIIVKELGQSDAATVRCVKDSP